MKIKRVDSTCMTCAYVCDSGGLLGGRLLPLTPQAEVVSECCLLWNGGQWERQRVDLTDGTSRTTGKEPLRKKSG